MLLNLPMLRSKWLNQLSHSNKSKINKMLRRIRVKINQINKSNKMDRQIRASIKIRLHRIRIKTLHKIRTKIRNINKHHSTIIRTKIRTQTRNMVHHFNIKIRTNHSVRKTSKLESNSANQV